MAQSLYPGWISRYGHRYYLSATRATKAEAKEVVAETKKIGLVTSVIVHDASKHPAYAVYTRASR